MDNDILKMLLDQINNNINVLREEHHINIDNINTNINENITEIKTKIEILDIKIGEIQKKYITKEYYNSNMKDLNNNIQIKKDEISLKKLTLILSCISAGIAGIISIITKVIN